MLPAIASLILGALLVGSAGLKLADGAGTRAALSTYGIAGRAATPVWAGLIAVELGLGIAVGAGVEASVWAAAALFCVFAAGQAAALASGRGGAPCACFGARGRIGRGSLARVSLLAIAFAILPLLDRRPLSTDEWLALGLGAALLGVVALGVAVLALARELGSLRAALQPPGALEIPEEGPELGGRSELMSVEPGRLGLAVFTSEGCRMCRELEPAVAALGRDPLVSLRTFDEVRDSHAWESAGIPGSPFAVALDADGTVLAKGTFNSARQLESVLAAAERRRG
ncbi:MAG: MauE/DoxX family redox-associated membrane protein [Solirubrobacteraceae bacterium]